VCTWGAADCWPHGESIAHLAVRRDCRSVNAPNPVSRLQIGTGFSDSDWVDWFSNYTAYIMPIAGLAGKHSIALFEVASELDIAFTTQAAQWRQVIASVRTVYSGPLAIAANYGTVHAITWWDALDFVSGDMYTGLGDILPLGVAPSVDDMVAAWQSTLDDIETLVNATGKPFLITEVGYQSRPSCHWRPWGTPLHDWDDDSAWLENHDPACQVRPVAGALPSSRPLTSSSHARRPMRTRRCSAPSRPEPGLRACTGGCGARVSGRPNPPPVTPLITSRALPRPPHPRSDPRRDGRF